MHRRVQDGLTQVQPLLLVHARSNSEYGLLLLLLLLLLRLIRVHHKRARLREGWRFADPGLIPLVGLRHHWFELAGCTRGEVEALADPRVLKHYQRPLSRQLDLSGARLTLRWQNVKSFQNGICQSFYRNTKSTHRSCLPMSPEAGSGDVGFIALGTDERPFIVVEPPMQF